MATSKELKETLVKEYGYTKKDFVNPETGKEYTFKKLESLLKQEQDKENPVEVEDDSLDEFNQEVVKNVAVKFEDSDLIPVMSGVRGRFIHHSGAGNGVYTFTEFGQVQDIVFKELKNIFNTKRTLLEDGYLIILNKDLIKEFRLEKQYKHVVTPKRVNDLLNRSADELISFLSGTTQEAQLALLSVAKVKYNTGELDKRSTIQALEEFFDTSLEDNFGK